VKGKITRTPAPRGPEIEAPAGRGKTPAGKALRQEELAPAPPRARGVHRAAPRASERDRKVFEAMRAGKISVEDGMRSVARNGGWPIETATGYLFAHPRDGAERCALIASHNGNEPLEMKATDAMFWIEVPMSTARSHRYKFSAGHHRRADPWARSYDYDADGEFSLTRSKGPHFERWPGVTDGVVRERTIRVWVPAKPPTHHLYVHDGQAMLDPHWHEGAWHLREHLGKHTLAIGIDATDERDAELTHVVDPDSGDGGKGAEYSRFVRQHVIRLVEEHYGPPKKRGVLGVSLGGLAAFNLARLYRGTFDFAGSISGTLDWGRPGEQMIDIFRKQPPRKTVFYLDSGDVADNDQALARMVEAMKDAGHREGVTMWSHVQHGGRHSTPSFADRVGEPVKLFERL
jgi:predicted alpha/beta superfamily hydrolase